MLSRFAQLFLLAALILLVPAGLYLSHGPEPLVRDPSTGSWYAANAPQTAQGNGPELPAAAGGLPGSTGQGVQGDPQSGAQGWKGALMGTVHKAGALWEQTWAGAAQQGQSPADRLAQEAQQFGLAQGKDATTDPEKGGAIMSKLGNATAK